MGKVEEKTNAMRMLDSVGAEYKAHGYRGDEALSAVDLADTLGIERHRVFKTLVTVGKSGEHYVFMIPGPDSLDLKKAAKAVGEKSIEMIKSKELFGITGYVHGGCSPIAMKKVFRTTIDETAVLFDEIVFSAGKVGKQIETGLDELAKCVDFTLADLTT